METASDTNIDTNLVHTLCLNLQEISELLNGSFKLITNFIAFITEIKFLDAVPGASVQIFNILSSLAKIVAAFRKLAKEIARLLNIPSL